MPEGPELHLTSRFINKVCTDRLFGGMILKSDVSRQPEIDWCGQPYTISASSRGKELKLILNSAETSDVQLKEKTTKKTTTSLDIVFQFGMSGKFDFYPTSLADDKIYKHAHLQFYTLDEPQMILSFIDYRRFGKWQPGGDWSSERGPCVLLEYGAFRNNVLCHLGDKAFNRPICEVLLNQKYFNGIGNYLRAEILYRLGIPPFVCARDVLEPLVGVAGSENRKKIKSENPDILQLCNILPLEVVGLGGTRYTQEGDEGNHSLFNDWLQCYYQPGMKSMLDHNKRTIWFKGSVGPLAPTEKKSGMKRKSKAKKPEETSKVTKTDLKKLKVEAVGDVKGEKQEMPNTKRKQTRKRSLSRSKKTREQNIQTKRHAKQRVSSAKKDWKEAALSVAMVTGRVTRSSVKKAMVSVT